MSAITNRPSESVRARCGPGVATTSALATGLFAESRTTPRTVPCANAGEAAASKVSRVHGIDGRMPGKVSAALRGGGNPALSPAASREYAFRSPRPRAPMSIREDLELLDQTQQ